MKSYLPYAGIFIGALLIIILQVSMVPVFRLTQYVNLALTVLIFVTLSVPFKYSFYSAIFLGSFLDVFSYLPFGYIILILLICWGGIEILQRNILTSYSLISVLLLTLIITILYQILLLVFSYAAVLFNQVPVPIFADRQWLQILVFRIISNSTVISILYLIGKLLSKRFNKVFIVR